MVIDRREGTRLTVGTRIVLCVGKERRSARLRNLSRFGAFVCCDPQPDVGTSVLLLIESAHDPRTLAAAEVIYQVGEASAERLGTSAGIGLRFRQPLAPDDARFTASITRTRTPQRTPTRPPMIEPDTRRMVPPVLSELRGACRPVAHAAPRFAGELTEVGVPYLLAMVERTQRSCRLELTCGGEAATIDFAGGRIAGAELASSSLPTDDVVSMVMRWTDGTFAMAPAEASVNVAATKSISRHLIEFERSARTARAARRGA